ncbi:hypothetical protein AKUH3B101J_13380 [Apilactobacillus kunkeei]|nr:hypothetical protein AKUH3B104J_13390 [Apilactobacillus kunkeei]CAI2658277.1 hypothetical protein AKUH3B101J_13380 [Apilactobacillus kunkeei]
MLNQKVEEKWKWMLIPMSIIFEVVIDDFVMQHIYRLFFILLNTFYCILTSTKLYQLL